ncbi:ABC-type transport auxiliary lipoprotein family protein [Stenotrophomonas sp. 24(2023)]|uniref:ABC-type transport auxiliary lipoprotein family protein n=1 Tax=Stenotrophomonas sp. 24(2023) TaxID=3068324 RepID=UPI0027E0C02D|nr:ABC-type transport auxiliary lipoprotein family protein [Stenotrophomonas sp. 24(2023)]WMJ67755.1 ABC-type transport auxiliary lipoprotein family protein [Stenotrophomonas sp. 24(2023)]
MSPMTLPRLLLAATTIALLGGCSILGSGDKNPVTLYSPSVQVKVDPSWPQASWQLVLAKPSAARMVDSPRINVRPSPNELEIYKGASWAQPATDMMEDALLRGFEDSGRIRGVARSAAGIRADYKLTTDIRRFESDYQGQATPTVVIELNAKLIHVADQRVVADRTFRQQQPVGSTDVPAVANAFQAGLQQLTQDVVGWTLLSGQNDTVAAKR